MTNTKVFVDKMVLFIYLFKQTIQQHILDFICSFKSFHGSSNLNLANKSLKSNVLLSKKVILDFKNACPKCETKLLWNKIASLYSS